MLLAYVDESYTDEWFVMGALLVDGPTAVSLTASLDQVAQTVAAAYGLPETLELHGYEIWHGQGAWSVLPVRARVGVFDDVVEAIAGHDVQIIARAMDVLGQRQRYSHPDPPHTVVLAHLLERIDEYAARVGEHALVIADEVDGQAVHRADLSVYREVGTVGYRRRRITRIVDTLHFAPSSASRLVQAVDVACFLYRRTFAHEETDDRAWRAKLRMWARLEPRLVHEQCWFPANIEHDVGSRWGEDRYRR